MDIVSILSIILICVVYRVFFRNRYQEWFIFIFSILGLFYFQPVSTIRHFDFWIPSISLLIGTISWFLVSKQSLQKKSNRLAIFSLIILFMLLAFTRFIPGLNLGRLVSIPSFSNILIFVMISLISAAGINAYADKKIFISTITIVLLAIFVVLKNEYFSFQASRILRALNDQSIALSFSGEIIWIGYSYFAFRLLHVIFDVRKRGKMEIGLSDFIGYLFFFPALLAGPIMRVEDYQKQFRTEIEPNDEQLIVLAFNRIIKGLFQKFILADLLALISMNAILVTKISSIVWMWFVVLMFAFRIYFDFSGYTHIAIGIAEIIGISLPENFNQPLRSPNLTIFWNRWHITLTQWFRTYYFNPVTRSLRGKFKNINPKIILAFMQISTMLLIGLWHGISWNFVAWGLWIGIGLYIQNQFTNWFMRKNPQGNLFRQLGKGSYIISVITTFTYISLGWVWFAMPDIETSLYVFRTLIGL